VLVVDDNRDAAEALAELCKLWGHQVWIAQDGPNALQMAESVRPDVVFLDIGLPVIDGYEVARRLRSTMQGGPFLVALTGYGTDRDRAAAHEAGFNLHITKPPPPERIAELLAQTRPTA
jgi:CheY-like chemotaxis protein